MSSDHDPVTDAHDRLHRSGWCVGDAAFHAEGKTVVWVVTGSHGENVIRAEGATRARVWRSAGPPRPAERAGPGGGG